LIRKYTYSFSRSIESQIYNFLLQKVRNIHKLGSFYKVELYMFLLTAILAKVVSTNQATEKEEK